MIDTREDAFDKITIFVQICAVGFELLAAGAQRDDRLFALELNESNQRIRVVAHVCDDHIGLGEVPSTLHLPKLNRHTISFS